MMEPVLPKVLWRRTERPFAEDLVERGAIKFSPLTYYWKSEGERGDEQEGSRKRNAAGLRVKVQDLTTGGWAGPIQMISGVFGSRLKRPECCHITCYSLTAEVPGQLGDTLIEMFDPQGFFIHVSKWMQREMRCGLEFGAVSYFDETVGEDDEPIPEPHLSKRSKYLAQSEFRFFFFCDLQKLVEYLSAKEGRPVPQRVNEISQGFVIETGTLRDYLKIVV